MCSIRSKKSKTYWNAKSAEVVSAMKTFVQAQLRGIENERMASRLDSLKDAYEMFASKVRDRKSIRRWIQIIKKIDLRLGRQFSHALNLALIMPVANATNHAR